jgi:hypothetical protein
LLTGAQFHQITINLFTKGCRTLTLGRG